MLNENKYDIVGAINKTTSERIPDDEPVFLVRAKDIVSFDLLLAYLVMCQEEGCSQSHLRGIVSAIHKFNEWQSVHRDSMRTPD